MDEVGCFVAGPRSDRSACVEEKSERKSILDSQNDRAKGWRRCLARALWVPPVLFQTRGFCFGAFIIAPRPNFGDDKAIRGFPSPRFSDSSTKRSFRNMIILSFRRRFWCLMLVYGSQTIQLKYGSGMQWRSSRGKGPCASPHASPLRRE